MLCLFKNNLNKISIWGYEKLNRVFNDYFFLSLYIQLHFRLQRPYNANMEKKSIKVILKSYG